MADEDNDNKKNPSLDMDRELVLKAQQCFESGKFESGLMYMSQLNQRRTFDFKMNHNVAVLLYCLSNYQMTDHFRDKLYGVCQQANIDLKDLDTVDDVDNCVVLYNLAMLYYHFHEYYSAINLLDKVFKFIEPLEDMLAKRVCFLFIECHLCVYQPKHALRLIAYTETNVLTNSKNGNKSSQKDGNGISDAVKRKLQLYKARSYAMMKTSKACKKEIKSFMLPGSQVSNIPGFYLKSQLEYQRGNYRKAIKVLNSATLPDDVNKYFRKLGDCLPAIYYNNVGCVHFYMGKPNLGIFYAQKALQVFEEELKEAESLIPVPASHPTNDRPLYLMHPSTKPQIVYNLGMQYFQARMFQEAFTNFLKAVQQFPYNPRLWLRIAECCMQIDKPDYLDELTGSNDKSFIKSVIGVGPHRKLVLQHSIPEKHIEDVLIDSQKPTLGFAMTCIKTALYMIGEKQSSNGGSTDVSVSSQSSSETGLPMEEEDHTLAVLPSNYLQGAEVQNLKNSILATGSYIALCVGDVILAYRYAQTLLGQTRISAAHKFLAHQYSAEALLIMDRITEAIEHHLNSDYPDQIEIAYTNNSAEVSLKHHLRFEDEKLAEKNEDGSRPVGNVPNWMPNAIARTKFVAQYNRAVAYSVREEWTKALECLNQIGPVESLPPQALSLLIYIQSHQGSALETKAYVQMLEKSSLPFQTYLN